MAKATKKEPEKKPAKKANEKVEQVKFNDTVIMHLKDQHGAISALIKRVDRIEKRMGLQREV